MKSDATRFLRDGVLTVAYEAGGAPALARVSQKPDGKLDAYIESTERDEALPKLRFILAADDDHSEFVRRFRNDPLIGHTVRSKSGMRPIRTATVAHSLLKAVCGQLIDSRSARLLEARLVRLACPEHAGLRLPPTRETFRRFTRAELSRHGLVSRKASALLRLTQELDLERLHGVSTDVAARRIERERGLGPWSAGMVCLYGLGRFECGLVGDLGLVKLVSAERGRWVETEETREILEPYGEWAGLASVYILAGNRTPIEVRPEPPRRALNTRDAASSVAPVSRSIRPLPAS
jgi:DNA-3-methyladenine glycosylase II/AraC family transcriptional regulator of adaptative response / DNA-3-methyladenine glycosylase II